MSLATVYFAATVNTRERRQEYHIMDMPFKSLVFVLALFSTTTSIAADKINEIYIVSGEWKDQTNNDGTGLFWDIFREIYEPVGIKLKFNIVPYSRSVYSVQNKAADAMVSAYPDEFSGGIFCDIPYLFDIVVAIHKKNKINHWNGPESLFGKVGWIRGYGYDQYFNTEIDFYEVDSHEIGLKMLNADRFDFFVTAENEIDDALAHAKQNSYLNQDEYEIVNPIMSLGLHLVFSDTVKGRELARIYNERMEELIFAGTLEPYYKKWATEYPIREWKELLPNLP